MSQAERPVVAVLERSNAYQATIVDGIRSVLEAAGHPLYLVSHDQYWITPAPSLRRVIEALRPIGVITVAMESPEADAEMRRFLAGCDGLRSVHIGSVTSGCHVRADNAAGMRDVIRHLVHDCGVRRPIVVLGKEHQPDSVDRERVVREELAAAGIVVERDFWVTGDFEREAAYAAVLDLLGRRQDFDAVIAFNDLSALGAMDALAAAGRRVPDDVVVTGFDDDEVAALSEPPLTSVDQRLFDQGATAASLIVDTPAGWSPESVQLATRLVVRASTGGPAESRLEIGDEVRRALHRLWHEISVRDTVMAMTRAFVAGHDVTEVVHALASALPRLGVIRGFLVLFDHPVPMAEAVREPGRQITGRVLLALDERRNDLTVADETFDVADLLPERLQPHLTHGTLGLQPLSTEDAEIGYLLLEQREPDRFVGEVIRLNVSRALEVLARNAQLAEHAQALEVLVARRTRELKASNDKLMLRLRVDGLTGIDNRVGFDSALKTQWSAHSRSGLPLSLLMVDVDHFKLFNDAYGHVAGDEALRVVARCMRKAVQRPDDVVARYGGEEFALILPNTPMEGAVAVAERVRAALAAAAVPHSGSPHGLLTVSIGAATVHPSPVPAADSLVARADAALYVAKDAGRDRVEAALPSLA